MDVIAVGQALLAAKETLPHGRFGVWLRAEFDWTERTARRFMAAAQRFGNKTDIVSVLRIDVAAAHLLAAPSVPEKAGKAALQRAESGERITTSVARVILGSFRSKPQRREKGPRFEWPTEKRRGWLLEILESLRQDWGQRQSDAFARQIRDFADSVQEKYWSIAARKKLSPRKAKKNSLNRAWRCLCELALVVYATYRLRVSCR